MEEESISIKIFEAATDKAIDKGLDELMVAVGLSENPPDLEAYFNQILAKLDEISSELQSINQSLNEIKDAQSLMRIQIQDVNFQNLLSNLIAEYNYVKNSFDFFHIALDKILKGDVEDGAREMYEHVLEYEKIFDLSNSLANIETNWLGQGSYKGMFYYLGELLKNNLESQWIEDKDKGVISLKGETVPDYFGVFDIYPESYAETLEQDILPEFNSCLTVLVKGLMILEVAFKGTKNQQILKVHYDQIKKINTQISTFLKDNTKTADINSFLEDIVRRNLKPCKDSFPESLFDDYTWWGPYGAPGESASYYIPIESKYKAFFPVKPWLSVSTLNYTSCFLIDPDFQFGIYSEEHCAIDETYPSVMQYAKIEHRTNGEYSYGLTINSPVKQAPPLVPSEEYLRLSAALADLYIHRYRIGDLAFGGIVFFVDESGQHGKVSSVEDLGMCDWSDTWSLNYMYTSNRAGDWNTPDIDELRLMYENLHKNGYGGFHNDQSQYWSSTKYEDDDYLLYILFFSGTESYIHRSGKCRLRAVRAF